MLSSDFRITVRLKKKVMDVYWDTFVGTTCINEPFVEAEIL